MTDQVPRIAVIEPVGGHGGMNYYDFGLCEGLLAARVDVVLHTCDETTLPIEPGFEVRHTYAGIYGQTPVWQRGLCFLKASFLAVWSAVREKRTVCHFHFFHVGTLQAVNVLLAKLFRRYVVITAHDVESFVAGLEMPTLSRWVYRQADRVIAHNRISQRELLSRIGLGAEKIAVIPHGNYLHAIRRLPASDEARKTINVSENAKVILFFGQIKDVKGLDLLLEAMPDVLQDHPNAVVLIAGKPWKNDFTKFEKQMEQLGIRKSCITHIRHIPDEDVPLYFSAADLVVLPYRRIYQSGVVLMALSYGKAVLVSDLPGMTEIVREMENGLVFRQEDEKSLAEKLSFALNNPALLEQLGLEGRKFVCDHHDWNSIGNMTSMVYSGLRDAV